MECTGCRIMALKSFMNCPTPVLYSNRIALRLKSHKSPNEGSVTFNCETIVYIRSKYARVDVATNTDSQVLRFTLPWSTQTTDYVNALWNKILPSHGGYDEYLLKRTLLKNNWNPFAKVCTRTGLPRKTLQSKNWCEV